MWLLYDMDFYIFIFLYISFSLKKKILSNLINYSKRNPSRWNSITHRKWEHNFRFYIFTLNVICVVTSINVYIYILYLNIYINIPKAVDFCPKATTNMKAIHTTMTDSLFSQFPYFLACAYSFWSFPCLLHYMQSFR